MDKIKKALSKLSAKERAMVKLMLIKLFDGKLFDMNIQKLHGHTNIYRIRKGNIRIIYQQKDGVIFVLSVERRSEKTYRDF